MIWAHEADADGSEGSEFASSWLPGEVLGHGFAAAAYASFLNALANRDDARP